MNNLLIPPAPQWYKSHVVTCAPDNTLVYGSRNDLILVRDKSSEEPAEIRIIRGAHSKIIISVSLNKKWKEPNCYAVSTSEDNTIKLWNLETLEKKKTNKDHTEHKNSLVGAVFAGDDRVVSATTTGFVVVWNINTNDSKVLKELFDAKTTLTCLSSCPHAGWLLAFGLSNGGVVIADLRRNGHVLYKLRGHYEAVVSLSWCPAPINVFPRYNQNKVKNKSEDIGKASCEILTQVKGIKPNPWINLVHADDGEALGEPSNSFKDKVSSFLEECNDLKSKILGLVETTDNKAKVADELYTKEPNKLLAEKDNYREEISDMLRICDTSQHLDNKRPLPKIFDPSGDFLNDSDDEDILEDKDVGNEKSTMNCVAYPTKERQQETGVSYNETISLHEVKNLTNDKSPIGEVTEELVGKTPSSQKDIEGNFLTNNEISLIDIDIEELAEEDTEGKDLTNDRLSVAKGMAVLADESIQPPDIIEEDPRTEYLLASSGRDETAVLVNETISPQEMKNLMNDKSPIGEMPEELVEKTPSSQEDIGGDDLTNNKTSLDKDIEELAEKTISNQEDIEGKDLTSDKLPVAKDIEVLTSESVPPPEMIEEEPRTEYLLASSGRDQSIYIWRAGTDGRMQTFFNAPKKNKNRHAKKLNTWNSICWVAPDTLMTSTHNGEVYAWPLPKPKDSSKQYKVAHCEHSAVIFNLVAPPKYSSEYDWRNKTDFKIWTWSLDGRLIHYDVDSEKMKLCYPTVTATVTCFESSPLDPNQLAIGQRDGVIRVWDLSLQQTKIVSMSKYQHKFTHKVTAVAWHPRKEIVLGFGTEEGSVGLIEMAVKKTVVFPHYFRTEVYRVEWGPINGDTNNLGLYVVSEGKMIIYDTNKPNDDPIQLQLSEKLHIYRFTWKPDFSVLLLSGKDGSLVILNSNLIAITTVYLGGKGLNVIVWHPDAFTDDIEISPRCNWFAVSTNKGLLVYKCEYLEENDNFMDNIVATLEGHLRPPTALAWSPFDGNKIVSTAADGLAQVWDIHAKCIISTFVDLYIDQNPAVMWSPNDPDLIIIGDRIIRVWSVSKHPPKLDEDFVTSRKRLLAKATKSEGEKLNKSKIKVDVTRVKSKNVIVPIIYAANDTSISLQIDNMRKLMMSKESENILEDDPQKIDPLKLFESKEQVGQLLTAKYNLHKTEGKHKSCELISLWKGNVGDTVQDAITENRVTPSIIMLAPMVSPKLWNDACEVYAKKLSEEADSDPLEAATYFLACHKVEEAINHLSERLMFKEALALAKQRFPDDSDIIREVTNKWAKQCTKTGNFETAALCYISVREYEHAAKMLARRNSKQFLDFAAELAEKVGNKGLYDSIKFKCEEIKKHNIEKEGNSISEEGILKVVSDCKDDISESELELVASKCHEVSDTEEQVTEKKDNAIEKGITLD